jgi:DNA-binding NarL/FixJ family response regulator
VSLSVLIADDEALVRAGFRMILESQPGIEVVGEVGDGQQAVAAARRLRPDVVLMDVRMPALDGILATAQLADILGAPTRIVILTTFALDEYVYGALRAGASGFLLKDTPPEQLIDAVRVVAAGEALLSPSITRRLIGRFAATRFDSAQAARLKELTRREVEVLQLLARGLSTGEIAEALFLGESSVKTHIAHVLTRLDLRDRVQAVIFAYESGLVEPGQAEDRSDALR